MVKKKVLASILFGSLTFSTFGNSFFQIENLQKVDNTTYFLSGIVINGSQIEEILKGYPYADRLKLSPIRVGSVTVTTDGKVLLRNLGGSGIYLDRLEVVNKNGTLRVAASNLEIRLKELLKNYPTDERLKVSSLVLEKKGANPPLVEVKNVQLFGGTIEKIVLTPQQTVQLKNLQGLVIPKILQLVGYFKPLNGLDLEGNLNLQNLSLDLKTLSVKIKEFNLRQGYYKGIFIESLTYSPEGLKIKGKIKNFRLTVGGQRIKIKGKFAENNLLKATAFELKAKLSTLSAKLKGNLNFNGKELFLLADKVEVKLSQRKEGKEAEKGKENQPAKGLPKIAIPDLPLDKVNLLIKELVVKVPLNVPNFKLRPFVVKNVELSYLGNQKLYTFHVGVCYSDLWGYRDKEQNISFLFTVPFVPASTLKGCFLEEISHPYLRDIFTSGYVNLFLGGFAPKGELSQMSGFLTLSLLDGYFYTERSINLPGKLNLAYNLASAAFNFIGVDLSEFNYSLYLSGDFRINETKLVSFLDTTAHVRKPKTFLFRGITKLFYNLDTSKGALELEGNTALPWGSLTIIKRRKSF